MEQPKPKWKELRSNSAGSLKQHIERMHTKSEQSEMLYYYFGKYWSIFSGDVQLGTQSLNVLCSSAEYIYINLFLFFVSLSLSLSVCRPRENMVAKWESIL